MGAIGTSAASSRIISSSSCRCPTLTSLAALHTWRHDGIVTAGRRVRQGDDGRETYERIPTQHRSLDDLQVGRLGQQHPHRDLQTRVGGVGDADGAITLRWSTNDPKRYAMKGVKRVEDVNMGGVCTQGSVGAGGTIRICIASYPAGAFPSTAPAGSPVTPGSSCRSECCRGCSAGCSSTRCSRRIPTQVIGSFTTGSFRLRF